LYSERETLIAVGKIDELRCQENCFENFKKFRDKNDWLFGFFAYDLKNEIELLSSENVDITEFPQLHFFCPEYIFEINKDRLLVHSFYDEERIKKLIGEIDGLPHPATGKNIVNIQPRVNKEEYLASIKKILDHIQLGDIYEVNYCMEYFAEGVTIDPLDVFNKLNEISRAPFSVFYRFGGQYVICASPERFLKKQGNKIISQPIKGTRKRSTNEEEDKKLLLELQQSDKEKTENIMIVDLARNDLSKSAAKGSVMVEELFGAYSFKQVHHLISTVSCVAKEGVDNIDIIKNTFPMASMTGVPKIRAMQLMEAYEKTKRSIYSGSIGYFTPDGDFDLNVVIRSILYNRQKQTLSFSVGSAITAASVPEEEYEECLVKGRAMFEVLK
jgi:para-aminobenzoate synthetase component 1